MSVHHNDCLDVVVMEYMAPRQFCGGCFLGWDLMPCHTPNRYIVDAFLEAVAATRNVRQTPSGVAYRVHRGGCV